MEKPLVLLITLSLLSNIAFAECDFFTGISKLSNGNFEYTAECHKKVGKTVADLKDREEQVAKLEKIIELKDLAINIQEKRADLWMNTSMKLEDRVNTIEQYKSTNQWLYFGLGVLVMGVAVWGAGQLR